jgi:heat shock protein HslJ
MRRLASLLVALVVVAAACGDDDDTSTVGDDSPWGRTFVTDGPPPVQLTFRDDEISARSECNTLLGTASIDGEVLVVTDVGSTEMGCDPDLHAYDDWLAGFLSSSPTISLDGATLTITGATDSLVLTDREVADPDRPLVGPRWVVDGLIDGDAVSSLPAGIAEAPWLQFTEAAVEGSAGCNDFSAEVTIGDGTIEVAGLTTTDVGCDAPTMAVEGAVHAALTGTVAYETDADRLTLTASDGRGISLRSDE